MRHTFKLPDGTEFESVTLAPGIEGAVFVSSHPEAADVRAECARRMAALVGARDAEHLAVILSNATREATRLLRRGASNWTAAEARRAAELEAADAAVEHLRAASNRLEEAPPDDYRNDQHWK